MKAVIFDWDGTLADTFQLTLAIWQEVLGKGFTEEDFKEGFGPGGKRLVENFFNKKGIPYDGKKVEALVKKKLGLQSTVAKRTPLLGGARELLDYLKARGYKMAVCSSNHGEAIEPVMRNHGLEGYFEKVITADHMKGGPLKPHPDIFLYTAKELGVSPKDCIVFEDAPVGVEAAKKADMKVIGVCTGHFTREEVSEKKPDLLIGSMKELGKIERFLDYL